MNTFSLFLQVFSPAIWDSADVCVLTVTVAFALEVDDWFLLDIQLRYTVEVRIQVLRMIFIAGLV